MMKRKHNVTDFSEFEQVRYRVSRKGTKGNTCTMGTNNSRVRKHYIFLGIIQMSFFAHCIPLSRCHFYLDNLKAKSGKHHKFYESTLSPTDPRNKAKSNCRTCSCGRSSHRFPRLFSHHISHRLTNFVSYHMSLVVFASHVPPLGGELPCSADNHAETRARSGPRAHLPVAGADSASLSIQRL
jgi:hypothetical protein